MSDKMKISEALKRLSEIRDSIDEAIYEWDTWSETEGYWSEHDQAEKWLFNSFDADTEAVLKRVIGIPDKGLAQTVVTQADGDLTDSEFRKYIRMLAEKELENSEAQEARNKNRKLT